MVNRIPLNNQNVQHNLQNNPDPQNHNPLLNNNRRVGIGLLNGIRHLTQRVLNRRAQELNPPADNRQAQRQDINQAQRQDVNLADLGEVVQNVQPDAAILEPPINNQGQQPPLEDLEQLLMQAINPIHRNDIQARIRIPWFYFVPIVGPVLYFRGHGIRGIRVINNRHRINIPNLHDIHDIDVHNADLGSESTGYPQLYRVLDSKINPDADLSEDKIKADINSVVASKLKTGEITKDSASKIRGAVTYMLSSGSANTPIMDYPNDITFKEILTKTWHYSNQSTQGDVVRQDSAIETLLNQLEDAAGTCSTGHASRILQSLCLTFPEVFPEPMTFAHARDGMQNHAKQLIQKLIQQLITSNHETGMTELNSETALNDEQIQQAKTAFLDSFESSVNESLPNVPQGFIQKFITEFAEPHFEYLLSLAIERTL